MRQSSWARAPGLPGLHSGARGPRPLSRLPQLLGPVRQEPELLGGRGATVGGMRAQRGLAPPPAAPPPAPARRGCRAPACSQK